MYMFPGLCVVLLSCWPYLSFNKSCSSCTFADVESDAVGPKISRQSSKPMTQGRASSSTCPAACCEVAGAGKTRMRSNSEGMGPAFVSLLLSAVGFDGESEASHDMPVAICLYVLPCHTLFD